MPSITKLVALLISPALAVNLQPVGVSDTLYKCTYDSSAKYLTITPSGLTDEIVCGAVDGEDKSFNAEQMEEMPTVKLNGHDKDAYYTLILASPEDEIPIAPILHQIVTNIKGIDLANGKISDGTEIVKYIRPNPPVIWKLFNYVYLVYK